MYRLRITARTGIVAAAGSGSFQTSAPVSPAAGRGDGCGRGALCLRQSRADESPVRARAMEKVPPREKPSEWVTSTVTARVTVHGLAFKCRMLLDSRDENGSERHAGGGLAPGASPMRTKRRR